MTDVLLNADLMPDLIQSRHEPSAERGLPARRIAMRARRRQEHRLARVVLRRPGYPEQ